MPMNELLDQFDVAALLLALLVSIGLMHWGYRIGVGDAGVDGMWKQILAVLYAYGGFLAVMVLALLLRQQVLRGE